MSKAKILLIVGVAIAGIPNLGLTNTMEKVIFLVLGLVVIFFAYSLFFQKQKTINPPKPKVPKIERPRRRVAKTIESAPVAEEDVTVVVEPKEEPREEITGFTYVKRRDENNGA